MGLILDTDHLIAAEKKGLSVRTAFTEFSQRQPNETFAVSVMTVAELRHGVERSSTPTRRLYRQSFLDELLDITYIVPVNTEIALAVGLLDAQLEMAGSTVAIPDLIIGCTALHMGYTLATKNSNHFQRIPGLQIINLI